MLRKTIGVLTIAVLLLGLCSCDFNEVITDAKDMITENSRPTDITTSNITIENADKCRVVTMQDYSVSFTLPNDWYVDMEDTALELFCTNEDVHMGVYGYFTGDFSDDTDYLGLWEEQNEADLERFTEGQKLEHNPKFDSQDKELATAFYTSDYENIKYSSYYIFAMPKKDADVFLWIVFGGLPSDVQNNFDVIEDIVDSIEFQ